MSDQKDIGPRTVRVCWGCRLQDTTLMYRGRFNCTHPEAPQEHHTREADEPTPDWCPVLAAEHVDDEQFRPIDHL